MLVTSHLYTIIISKPNYLVSFRFSLQSGSSLGAYYSISFLLLSERIQHTDKIQTGIQMFMLYNFIKSNHRLEYFDRRKLQSVLGGSLGAIAVFSLGGQVRTHPHRPAYCTPFNLVFIVQDLVIMITCFGTSILVSLLALCCLHKKTRYAVQGNSPRTLNNAQAGEDWQVLYSMGTPLLSLYHLITLPVSLPPSSLHLNQLSHQNQTHASHLLVNSPVFLCRSITIPLLLCLFFYGFQTN